MHHEALTEEGKALFPLLKKFSSFYLAGGTALALQIGHRISVDFDLFSGEAISKNLLTKIKKVFDGRSVAPTINNADELTVLVDGVKITFLKYPFPLLDSLVEYEGMQFLSVREIAATKAYTVGRRGSYKDYVDLYCIVSAGHALLQEIIDLAEKKFGAEFNGRLFLEQLLFLEDASDTELRFLKPHVSPEQVIELFKEKIAKLQF